MPWATKRRTAPPGAGHASVGRIVLVLLAAIAAAVALRLVAGPVAAPAVPAPADVPASQQPGDVWMAPEIDAALVWPPGRAGERLRLSALRGRTVVLNFWAGWCGPCREELPLLDRYAAGNALGRGPVILAINLMEPDAAVQRAVRALGLVRLPVVLDARGKLAEAYRVWSLPTSFVIDPSGAVRARWVGPVAEENLVLLH